MTIPFSKSNIKLHDSLLSAHVSEQRPLFCPASCSRLSPVHRVQPQLLTNSKHGRNWEDCANIEVRDIALAGNDF